LDFSICGFVLAFMSLVALSVQEGIARFDFIIPLSVCSGFRICRFNWLRLSARTDRKQKRTRRGGEHRKVQWRFQPERQCHSDAKS
jgi:hypothetical protein